MIEKKAWFKTLAPRGIWLILGAVAFLLSSVPATVHVVCEHADACSDSGAPTCVVCAKLVGNPPVEASGCELPPAGAVEFLDGAPVLVSVVTGGIPTLGRAPPYGPSSV